MALELLIIAALVLINGILAGAEIAIIAARRTRLQELAEEGVKTAQAALSLRRQPEKFLATVQIGITLVSASAGAFGGATLATDLARLMALWPPLTPVAEQLALALVVLLVSFLSLVLGELVPKSLALKHAERYSLLISRPLTALAVIFRPLVSILTASSNVILRLVGDRTSFSEARLSPDELAQLVEEAAQAGTVDPRAGKIAARALEFPDLRVEDVMIPRPHVVSLSLRASKEQLRRLLLEENHTRFPVYRENPELVVGYINVKDILAVAWEEGLFVLEDLLRPPIFIPTGSRAVDLLGEMRQRRTPFAIVVNEHGTMAGIVTLEDLLEELVGEIFSEQKQHLPPAMLKEAPGIFRIQASTPVREINRELGLKLPEGDWTTLSGLLTSITLRIPAAGERISLSQDVLCEVLDASSRRVRIVRLWTHASNPTG